LHGGTRKDRRRRIADRHDDRPGSVRHARGTAVTALDQGAASHLNHYRIIHCRPLSRRFVIWRFRYRMTRPSICASFGAFTSAKSNAWSAMKDTWPLLEKIPFPALARRRLVTLQVNVGYRCNQSCVHCHVAAGPHRAEQMDAEVIDLVLAVLAR